MAVFLQPKWDSSQAHYVIETTAEFRAEHDNYVPITRDTRGSTSFTDEDTLHNVTDDVLEDLIQEGGENKWFSKLPSHEQLMKRVVHNFAKLASEAETRAVLATVLMTPKQLTFLWMPLTPAEGVPPMYIEDSEGSEEEGEEPEIQESNLPAVALKNPAQETHEEYLLTRLRAAKARVEAEQIRMQYFEATGQMPPDSEDEDE